MNSSVFDAQTVRALATILADTGLSEIEVTDGERRVRLCRTVSVAPAAAAAAPAPVATAPPPSTPAASVPEADHPGTLTSPMVGIAYLSAEPGSAPFVAPGQGVVAGQTLLLIEAMKTFNQIKAVRSGTVTRVLVSSGQAVEYGQALMVLE